MTAGLMKERCAPSAREISASIPAIARVGERTPSQATTRSAGSSRSPPDGSRSRTPVTRPPSRESPVTSRSCATGIPSARISLTRTNGAARATGVPSA